MGSNVTIRFYAELNDFLPKNRRQMWFAPPVAQDASVKHLIESLGVPHTEVDLVLVNGEVAEISQRIHEGDRISVFPRFRTLDLGPDVPGRPSHATEPRFVLDGHLGKLATYLRLLGFDTLYTNHWTDSTLADITEAEGRILLTRDRALLMRRQVVRGMFVRADDPEQQAIEVIRRFDLLGQIAPFTRCLHCNAVLAPVSKDAIIDRLLPKTRRYYDEFRICPSCDQIYWRGSHWQHMHGFIDRLKQAGAGTTSGERVGEEAVRKVRTVFANRK